MFTNPSMEWASWLLDLLLADEEAAETSNNTSVHLSASSLIKSPSLFNAMITYLRTSGMPGKTFVVDLLIRLLQNPQECPDFEIDLLKEASNLIMTVTFNT